MNFNHYQVANFSSEQETTTNISSKTSLAVPKMAWGNNTSHNSEPNYDKKNYNRWFLDYLKEWLQNPDSQFHVFILLQKISKYPASNLWNTTHFMCERGKWIFFPIKALRMMQDISPSGKKNRKGITSNIRSSIADDDSCRRRVPQPMIKACLEGQGE